jgi:hypothetical protein
MAVHCLLMGVDNVADPVNAEPFAPLTTLHSPPLSGQSGPVQGLPR